MFDMQALIYFLSTAENSPAACRIICHDAVVMVRRLAVRVQPARSSANSARCQCACVVTYSYGHMQAGMNGFQRQRWSDVYQTGSGTPGVGAWANLPVDYQPSASIRL